ncbi:enoyl-[acyl-carrier protein] reductase I [Novimethylophilus kurashikiensis]|uniref:Enoyl-[acyl-carrier-protein] reductase [NADH] n=1 Tax=Novimethylophilus kurashikiensis TaxID=1825523 RepID=A0A2R5F4L1_9PROT|nr:SDR family oxidoreductase [Novimethylophilus kurashikiensis]GBG12939.1 enoyl-[acyl-carrier protein] reductase I [Novimethylophilus kurashikiensis]
MGFLTGKRALIVGLLSNRSIAYGIAQAMKREGAELAFTYQTERFEDRVKKFGAEFGTDIVLPCDVAEDSQIDALFESLKTRWTDGFDILVHSVAFVPKDALDGDYMEKVDREYFRIAHDISSYSFSALAKGAMPLMEGRNGSMLTISYIGAERTLPNYNVMGVAKASLEANVRYMAQSLGPRGIRVNAVSAGPIKTLAASGISGFDRIIGFYETHAPLRRCASIEEVGNASAFLCSDLASGITGEVTYVDGGFNITAAGNI